MKRTASLLVFLFLAALAQAQTDHCDKFDKLLEKAQTLWKQKRFDDAFAKLSAAREACPSRATEVDKRYADFIRDIAGKYEMADRKTQEALAATAEAERARTRALREQQRAEENARRAYSTYANYIALESQTALLDGDLNTAFRLAEFAHYYVDSTNANVNRALVEVFYYNENPDEDHRLPWVSNLKDLKGHTDYVRSVAFSPDGKRLATASDDKTAKIWDVATGALLITLEGHTNTVRSVAFSPDGKKLATGSEDETVKIWDGKTGENVATLTGHASTVRTVAFSPDGSLLASGSDDKTIKLWDWAHQTLVNTLTGHTDAVKSVAFSPDGGKLVSGSHDNTAKIWNVRTGAELLTLQGHDKWVNTVAFSPDGSKVATGSEDQTAKIWNAETGSELHKFTGHTVWILGVAFSPDGKKLVTASGDNTAKIWNANSGKEYLTLRGHTQGLRSVAFSPDGKKVATGSEDETAKIWVIETQMDIPVFKRHTDAVLSVAFSHDGKWAATGSADHTAKVWDLRTGKEDITLDGHADNVRGIAFSADDRTLATVSADSTARIWDRETGKELLTLRGHQDEILSVAFVGNQKKLLTGSKDNTVKLWDLETGKELSTFQKHLTETEYVAFSQDQKLVAILGTDKKDAKQVTIWNLENGKDSINIIDTELSGGLAFSPDGKRLATGSEDNSAKIWDVETGKELLSLSGHNNLVISLVFSPDGKRLATGAKDNDIKLWDLETGKELLTLTGHEDDVNCLAFSVNGKTLLSGSDDSKARIWDLNTDTVIRKISGKNTLAALTLEQLKDFDLENLLETRPENEAFLCSTKSPEQIAAFAKLYDENTQNSHDLRRTAADFARATRLYRRALECGGDSTLRSDLGTLYQHWAEDILETNRPDTAATYIEFACEYAENKVACPKLWVDYAEKTGKNFDYNRFLASNNPQELQDYGDYFYGREKWTEARQLYEKAESKKHSPQSLKVLFQIAEKTGTVAAFNFNRFLNSTDFEELKDYGDFFFLKEQWGEAWRLYEKAEAIEHSSAVLKNMFVITEHTDKKLDFNRFLMEESPYELHDYGNFFLEKEKWTEAKQLFEKAETLQHDPENLKNLYDVGENLKEPVALSRFLASDNTVELQDYAEFFFNKEKWPEAKQLYTKSESIQHAPENLKQLYTISENMDEKFDLNAFLVSEDVEELQDYAEFFFDKEKWPEAKKLNEKAENKQHSAKTLVNLYRISQKTGEPFEFNRFLSSTSPEEIDQYADLLADKDQAKNKDKVPGYRQVAQLREKQMALDTSAEVRIKAAKDYMWLSYYLIYVPDGKAAEAMYQRSFELDPTLKLNHTNLAPALMLQGKFQEAEAEYKKWAPRPYDDGGGMPTYREAYLDDLRVMEEQDVPFDYERVKAWLNEDQ